MVRKLLITSVLSIILLIGSSFTPNEASDMVTKKIYQFNIKEEIGPAAWRTVKKSIANAEEMGADYILIHMNTYGGMVDMADSIRTAILNCKIPIIVFVDNNAASAGALISIACDKIYMRTGASIGAATVVNQAGEKMPDKYQSYMRSMMRSTAETKGRDPKIAEAMVDENLVVEGITKEGQVLTFTTSEAQEHGFCDGVAESIEEVLMVEGIENYEIEEYKVTALEKVIRILVNPALSGFLIMIIIGGIYFELQTPGVGFPLLAAIIAATLYFAPHYLEGLASHWEIFLFFMGVILLVLEIFVIPGFGIAGVAGILSIIFALTFSLIHNDLFDFDFTFSLNGWEAFTHALFTVFISMGLSILLSIVLGKKVIKSNYFARNVALSTTQKSEEGYTVDTEAHDIIGKTGIAVTVLRPSGKVEIDNERYDANTEGDFIEKDENIKVIGKESSHLIVRKA
ncbi:MAG: nodulation protein NfeD [Bacteroidia bacterium]|nr:nodulation protein NfeD [Bacteroidia bacterium]